MEEIFEIKDVDLYYGPKQVLKKVNLNLQEQGYRFYWTIWMWKINAT